MADLSFVSLNVERSGHLDIIAPFLTSRMPDVFCAQELNDSDIPFFTKTIGAVSNEFSPMSRSVSDNPPKIMGIGIFSRLPILRSAVHYYGGDPERVPDSVQNDRSTANMKNFMVLECDIEKEGTAFKICTTHFTWTPDGKPSDFQRSDMEKLLATLDRTGEFVLAGDFNAPRGGEIFSALAAKYKDNIPLRYTTSIDARFHRAGKTKPRELADKMVDGLFTTPRYAAEDVELIAGVSDHMAVVASLSTQTG